MEVPREFYKKRINELVRHTNAEAYDGMVFLGFVRGQKQITIQFKRELFESLNVLVMIQEIVGPLCHVLPPEIRMVSSSFERAGRGTNRCFQ